MIESSSVGQARGRDYSWENCLWAHLTTQPLSVGPRPEEFNVYGNWEKLLTLTKPSPDPAGHCAYDLVIFFHYSTWRNFIQFGSDEF